MPVANKIFVTGAAGNQGGATVRNLLSKGFQVKALIRNSTTPISPDPNLEIVKGDLNDPASYREHLHKCDGVFCLLTYAHGINKEIKQGLDLVNESKQAGAKHFIYSSVIGNDLNTGIPHWESKYKIENYLKTSGLMYTILRPASLYENLLIPQIKTRVLKGKLVLPTKKQTVQQFIASEDIGKIATNIFSNSVQYENKTLNLAAEEMDGGQLAETFSKVMGKEIKFQQLPGFITRLAMGRDLAKMFRWINNNDARFVKDMPSFKNEFPGMLSLEEWIKINFK